MPFNCAAWKAYTQLEINVGETQRARGIFDIAISESDLDMPEVPLPSLPPQPFRCFGKLTLTSRFLKGKVRMCAPCIDACWRGPIMSKSGSLLLNLKHLRSVVVCSLPERSFKMGAYSGCSDLMTPPVGMIP